MVSATHFICCIELFEITPTTELSTPPPGATAKITAEYFLNSTDVRLLSFIALIHES